MTAVASPQQRASDVLQAGAEAAREDLDPFRETGVRSLESIESLIFDPNAQKDFVSKNPFFKALADDAQRRIFNNQAARGKIGSGGTAEALQNSILLLGDDLVGTTVDRGFGLASLGAGAASESANITLDAADAEAAGILGLENTRRADARADDDRSANTLGTIAGLAALAISDRRMKENITRVGDGDVPIYFFNYKGRSKLELGTMAQDVGHIEGAVINMGGKQYVNYSRL